VDNGGERRAKKGFLGGRTQVTSRSARGESNGINTAMRQKKKCRGLRQDNQNGEFRLPCAIACRTRKPEEALLYLARKQPVKTNRCANEGAGNGHPRASGGTVLRKMAWGVARSRIILYRRKIRQASAHLRVFCDSKAAPTLMKPQFRVRARSEFRGILGAQAEKWGDCHP